VRTRCLTITAAFVVVTLAMPAARAATVDDPNNARGPLDLRRLVATKHDAKAPLKIRITTYGTWSQRLLDASGANRLRVLFNTGRSRGAEYVGEIAFRNGHLSMTVRRANGAFVRRLRVRHPDGDRVAVTVPRGLPNPDGNLHLAASMTYRAATGICASTCGDRVPNVGWLKVTPGQ